MIHISAAFDGGNIEVLDASEVSDIRLEIRPDHLSKHLQWFYFRVSGARGRALRLRIMNAGSASYRGGWRDYQAVASYDRRGWFRVSTRYEDETLQIEHEPAHDSIYFAYFSPYSLERHADRIARLQTTPEVAHEVLGETLDGRELDLLRIGEPEAGRPVCWIIGRQHPGETMAEWMIEGLLERLVDPADAVGRALREKAVFYVVPNMNPDGSHRGHLRTNAAGTNLNRAWLEPSLEQSPEVFLVRERMHETGVSFCLDVHGDEALPYNFIAGSDGVGSLDPEVLTLRDQYCERLTLACPDFQTEVGYPIAPKGEANLKLCTNYCADAFGCLAMTLEQPFKDAANSPLPGEGWSPRRARRLGAASLDALLSVLPSLPAARPLDVGR